MIVNQRINQRINGSIELERGAATMDSCTSKRHGWWMMVSLLLLLSMLPQRPSAFVPQHERQLNKKTIKRQTALWQASVASRDPLAGAGRAKATKQPAPEKNLEKFPTKEINPSSSVSKTIAISQEDSIDTMRARAGVLRRSILQQQVELQQLERRIMCCSHSSEYAPLFGENTTFSYVESLPDLISLVWTRSLTTFRASTDVLLRKLKRVQTRNGVNNQIWRGSIPLYIAAQTASGVRIVDRLLRNQTQLLHLINEPTSPSLVPHVPAILARLDKLEGHVPPILERVLNDRKHLSSIEPYLPEILERFDDIEPHLSWILDHIDVLAPYTGLLLKHLDELLPYANWDESEGDLKAFNGTVTNAYKYALAEQLLPYLEFYVSRLDTVGPHLPLLRPHVPKLLKHNRIEKMTPHIDRLFALGYKDDLGASANMDVLLWWFGWALRVPGLPRLFFAIPGSPRIVTFLANRLPKRFVRGYCSGVTCMVDGDYGGDWRNRLSRS